MTDYHSTARAAARRYGLDEDLFERQIGAESGFNPSAHSPAGAVGIAQIMPATARGWGVNPNDPVASLNAAAKNMASYVKKFGSYENALRAYNAGPGNVKASHGFSETNAYVNKIMRGEKDPSNLGSTSASDSTSRALSLTSPGIASGITGAMSGMPSIFDTLRDYASATRAAPIVLPGSTPQSQYGQTPTGVELSSQWPYNLDQPRDPYAQINTTQKTLNTQLQTTMQQIQNIIDARRTADQAGTADIMPTDVAPTGGPALAASKVKGTANFEDHTVAGWIAPILAYARAHGWKGQVNSGFRSFEDQTRIYNSGVRPAAKPGTSNHEGAEWPRGAVDVSDAQQLSDILRKSKYAKVLVWAGGKDPVHFSHPHGGSY